MAPPAGRNPCWGKNGSMLKRADARPLFFGASWGVSRSGARYLFLSPTAGDISRSGAQGVFRAPARRGCFALRREVLLPMAASLCCGAQNFCAALRRALEILTAATRSPRCIRHRRRSDRSQKRHLNLRFKNPPTLWLFGCDTMYHAVTEQIPCRAV